jgi:hypothetical protein
LTVSGRSAHAGTCAAPERLLVACPPAPTLGSCYLPPTPPARHPRHPPRRTGSVHPFFFGCQYHPEFQSHPHRPSPPFFAFILAASGQLEGNLPLPPMRQTAHRAMGGAAGGGSYAATPSRGGGGGELAAAGAVLTAPPSPSATLAPAGSSEGASSLPMAPLEKSPARPVTVPQVLRVSGGLQPGAGSHPSSA